ncbi:hypothetical protein VcTj87_25800 [Vibrio comitans]
MPLNKLKIFLVTVFLRQSSNIINAVTDNKTAQAIKEKPEKMEQTTKAAVLAKKPENSDVR